MLARSVLALTTCSILLAVTGCTGSRPFVLSGTSPSHGEATPVEETSHAAVASDSKSEAPAKHAFATAPQRAVRSRPVTRQQALLTKEPVAAPTSPMPVRTVSHEPTALRGVPTTRNATLNLNGRTYQVQLLEESVRVAAAPGAHVNAGGFEQGIPIPPAEESIYVSGFDAHSLPLNLPTALSMIGGQHPAVGFAQWRVQEAYANLDQAKVLWLPSIQSGFSFHRHDGNYQASTGSIVDVNRNSFQYGLGAGATGAGTTNTRPGVVANFHLADAIFQPKIARKTAWAHGHAANGIINEQLRIVAISYLEWIEAQQELRIIEESQARTLSLSKLTADFADAGEGLQADADRLRTESMLIDGRLASSRERIEVAGASLKQSLSIDTNQFISPIDPTVVPIDLVSLDQNRSGLIASGLSNRPELKEAQALVAVACERYKRQKYSPFVPSVLLGFSTGGFGGGTGSSIANVRSRYDFDAVVTWEVRNLGFGERSARRGTAAQIQQAKYEKIRVMDQVARDVSVAHSQAIHRSDRVLVTQNAIKSARDSYERNVSRIRDGQGLPLEALQSVQAMEAAQRAYLSAVSDYNRAQFQLQWALGWPASVASQQLGRDR